MFAELRNHWCVLCLHDGSEDDLVDVLSVSELSDKIAEEYDVCIKQNDLPAKICMPCFQETLSFRKQRRLYEAEKERILKNQDVFRSQTHPHRVRKQSSSVKLPVKSKSTPERPKDSANDIFNFDANSGNASAPESKRKGRLTIKLVKRPSGPSTSSAESEKNTASKKIPKVAEKRNASDHTTQGCTVQNAVGAKKRVRFSIQTDTDEDSTSPPLKRIKYAESVEEANVSSSKKQTKPNDVNKKPHGPDEAGSANGQQQQQQQIFCATKDTKKTSTKNQRPSASGGDKTEAGTASGVAAVKRPAAATRPTIESVPASAATVGNTTHTGSTTKSAKQKPSKTTNGGGTSSAGSNSNLPNGSLGKVAENVHSLSTTTAVATIGSTKISLTDPNATKGLKKSPKISMTKVTSSPLGTLKLTPATITVSSPSASVPASTTVSTVTPGASVSSSSNSTAVTSASASGVSNGPTIACLTSKPSQVCATSASSSGASSAALVTTCPLPSSNKADDPVRLTAAGQLPTTCVVNATSAGVAEASNNAGSALPGRQVPPVTGGLLPAMITVSESESIYTFGSMTTAFGSQGSLPSSTNTSTVTGGPIVNAVPDEPRQWCVVTTTPTVAMQPTVTSVVSPTTSSPAVAPLQQGTVASVATAASADTTQVAKSVGIKKRRHSTFIRVNPNLFDEPTDQFASIRKNLLLRTAESTGSSIQLNPFLINGSLADALPTAAGQQAPASTVANTTQPYTVSRGFLELSQINRTQTSTISTNQRSNAGNSGGQVNRIAPAPLGHIPIHIVYRAQLNAAPNMPSRPITAKPVTMPQTVSNGPRMNLVRGPVQVVGGQNQPPRYVSIRPNQPLAQGNASVTVGNTYTNTSVRPGTGAGTGGTPLGVSTAPVDPSARTSSNQVAQTAPPNSNSTQTADSLAQKFPVYTCQLCAEFFLCQPSLTAHLNQVHYVEYAQSLCTTIYDESIRKILVARERRKSIASPDDLRFSR